MELSFLSLISVLGLIFGSFATVLTYRIPRGESIVTPGSFCPECRQPIRSYDKIPLLSFAILRGKCRTCHAKIGVTYPLIEISTVLLFVISFSIAKEVIQLISFIVLAVVTMPLVVTDFQLKRLPNRLTYAGILIGLVMAILASFRDGTALPLKQGLLLSAGLGIAFFLLHVISRGGMGMGDVKLSIMLGALLFSVKVTTVVAGLFIAFLLGSIAGVFMIVARRATRKSAIPFGPFMLLGVWFALTFEKEIQSLIESLFRV